MRPLERIEARERRLRRAAAVARKRLASAESEVEYLRGHYEEACGLAALGDEGDPVEEAEARLDAAEREARRARAAVAYFSEQLPRGAGAAA